MHVLSVGNCFHRYFLSFYIELHNKQVTFIQIKTMQELERRTRGMLRLISFDVLSFLFAYIRRFIPILFCNNVELLMKQIYVINDQNNSWTIKRDKNGGV